MATIDSSVLVSLFNNHDRLHSQTLAWFREAVADGEPLRAPVIALAERAATLAAEHQLRGSDAIYFAVAETLGDSLVTLNPRQVQRGNLVVETRRPKV